MHQQALQLLMSQCCNFEFHGACCREWELAFDEMDIMIHPNEEDEIAITSSWEDIDDFVETLELALSLRPIVPFDVYLIYDDEAKYQMVIKKLEEIGCEVLELGYFIEFNGEKVQDPLSTLLSLSKEDMEDERVQICIDEMLKLFINEQSVKQWIFELQQIEEVLLNKKQVCIRELISYCGQRVSIFGAGINAKSLFLFINKFIPEINVEYFLVSNTEDNFSHICDIPVIRYDSLSEDEAHIVLLGVSNPVIKEIESIMEMLQNYIWVRVDLLTVKQVYRGLSCLEKKKESWYQ